MLFDITKFLRKKIKKQNGFTLIELMIVIVIIGILSAIALPKFKNVSGKAIQNARKAQLTLVQNAVDLYYVENNTYPVSGQIINLESLITEKYLDKKPIDPKDGSEVVFRLDTGSGKVYAPENWELDN